MVIIAGGGPVLPEKWDEAVAAANLCAELTQPEKGCIQYRFYARLDVPNTIFVYEEWASQADLDAHLKAAHTQEFLQKLPGYAAGEFKVNRYETEGAAPLF